MQCNASHSMNTLVVKQTLKKIKKWALFLPKGPLESGLKLGKGFWDLGWTKTPPSKPNFSYLHPIEAVSFISATNSRDI